MTTCTLLLGIITCVLSGPPPSPAASAALLAPRQYVHPVPATGPWVTTISSKATDGPFGPIVVSAPTVRLDGTPLTEPPWQAIAFIDRYRGYGYGRRGRR